MALDPRILNAAAEVVRGTVDGQEDFATSALWMRSVAMRDVLARVLVPDTDFDTLRELLRSGQGLHAKDADEANRWAEFAMVIGYQQLAPSDTEDAIAMFAVARAVLPVDQWRPKVVQALVDLLWLGGRAHEVDAELLDAIRPIDRLFFDVDQIGRTAGIGSSRWIDALNQALASRDVAAVGLGNPGATAFDRLSSTVVPGSVGGPLVTVIMSAFKPGEEIFSAVRSILDQTWADLELLVIDDASGAEFDSVLDRVDALDDRVKVVRQPTNGGTYAARNTALGLAAGEFITFQDSDDWSHPERIERQVRPLLERPHLLGTHSASIRASPDLVFQRLGVPAFRPLNASSHLFRRSVIDRLGGFDRVRKGADTEFHLRMEAAFPHRNLRIWTPLAFVRLDENSLSRSDFLPGWWHPDRAEYRDAMSVWHRNIQRGADPQLGSGRADWPLTAPRNFLRGSGVALAEPDLLLLADWTVGDTVQRASLNAVRGEIEHGRSVGIVQARSHLARAGNAMYRLGRSVRQSIASGVCAAVSLEDDVHVATLVVVQPDVLQFPPSAPTGLTADRVEIVDDGGEGDRWARADVERVVGEWFGVEPTWRGDPRPKVDQDLLATPRNRFRGQRPIVGWIAEPDGSDLPAESAVASEAYPAGEALDVRLVGVRQPLARRGIKLGKSWLVYEAEDVTAREFWHQVDFAVAAPADPNRKALEHAVGEALAAGCVVVLPPRFASWFDDAVIAAEPSDMAAIVLGLRNDRAAYLEQVDRGRSWSASSAVG